MIDDNSVIRSLFAPQIKLDDMVMEDLFTGTSDVVDAKGGLSGRQYQNMVGVDYPFVIINGYTFAVHEIIKLSIDATGFLPDIDLTVAMTSTDTFKTARIPKDGDLISVFIRAKNDSFKPIRNDYIITYVDVAPNSAPEGRGSTITLRGTLFIPHIDDQVIKFFEGSSFDVLQKIAKELKLGFATNESSTDDSQVWICPGDSLKNTILDVTAHSYKDEKSFYNCFIDIYYHLNFINVNTQVVSEGKMSAAILDFVAFKDDKPDLAQSGSQQQGKKFLSDMENFKGTNFFVETYSLQNNSTAISKRWGYKTYVQFYDQQTQDTWSIYVDPIVTEGAQDKAILLKGRPYPKAADGTAEEKYWEKQNKYVWLGVQTKNVHDMYLYSKIWNKRNLEELDKLYLEVEITRWNPNMYRGEKIPIILYTMGDPSNVLVNEVPAEANTPVNEPHPVANQFYSGYYMIDGFTLNYTISKTDGSSDPPPEGNMAITQNMVLRRREWPIPATG